MAEWISVNERLPEDDKAVLTCGPRGGMYIAKAYGYKIDPKYLWWKMVGTNKFISVTHWMPLPEPPREGGGEDG